VATLSKCTVQTPFDWLPHFNMGKRRTHLNLQWLDTQQTLYFHQQHSLHVEQRSVPLILKIRWAVLLEQTFRSKLGRCSYTLRARQMQARGSACFRGGKEQHDAPLAGLGGDRGKRTCASGGSATPSAKRRLIRKGDG
jgi:hypothetical protein